jgi:hypothetical protein
MHGRLSQPMGATATKCEPRRTRGTRQRNSAGLTIRRSQGRESSSRSAVLPMSARFSPVRESAAPGRVHAYKPLRAMAVGIRLESHGLVTGFGKHVPGVFLLDTGGAKPHGRRAARPDARALRCRRACRTAPRAGRARQGGDSAGTRPPRRRGAVPTPPRHAVVERWGRGDRGSAHRYRHSARIADLWTVAGRLWYRSLGKPPRGAVGRCYRHARGVDPVRHCAL